MAYTDAEAWALYSAAYPEQAAQIERIQGDPELRALINDTIVRPMVNWLGGLAIQTGRAGFESSPIGYLGNSWSGPAAGNWSLNQPVGSFNDLGSWIPANYLSDAVHQDFFGNNQYQEFMRGAGNTGGITSLNNLFGGGQYLPTTHPSEDIARQLSLLGQGLYDLFGGGGSYGGNGGNAGSSIIDIISNVAGGGGGGGGGTSAGWPSGGGGGGGGGNTDWSSIVNAGAGALLDWLGGGGGGGGGGGRKPRTGRIARNIARRTFDSGTRQDVADFLSNRVPLLPAETSAISYLNTLGPELAGIVPRSNSLLDTLNTGLTSMVEGTYEPGAQPNIDPAIALAERTYRRLTEPQMASTFAGNLFSTDYDRARSNAARDISTELGALSVNLNEAAKNRAAQAIGTGYTAGLPAQAAPVRNAVAAARDLLLGGASGRVAIEGTRPGAAPPVPSLLDSLTSLAGVESQIGFPQQPNYQAGGLGAAGLAALPSSGGGANTSILNTPGVVLNLNSGGSAFGASAPRTTDYNFFGQPDRNYFSTTGLRFG